MTAQIHFRIPEEEKKELAAIYGSYGLSINDAFRVFIKKSIESQGFPFEMQPNNRLQAAMKSDNYQRFSSPEQGLNFLND